MAASLAPIFHLAPLLAPIDAAVNPDQISIARPTLFLAANEAAPLAPAANQTAGFTGSNALVTIAQLKDSAIQQTSFQQTDPIAAVRQDPLALESDSIGIKSPTAGVWDQASLVANFTNVRFALTDNYGNAHQLQIQTLDIQGQGAVVFKGLWDSEKVTGYITYDAARNVSISFKTDQLYLAPYGPEVSYPDYDFSGTISPASQGYHIEGSYIDENWQFFGGDVVHVAGDQTFPTSDTIQQQDPLAAAFSQLTQQGLTDPNANQVGLFSGPPIGTSIGNAIGGATGDQQAAAEAKKQAGVDDLVANLKQQLDSPAKDLEAQDKLGNFQLQGQMADMKQVTTTDSIKEKLVAVGPFATTDTIQQKDALAAAFSPATLQASLVADFTNIRFILTDYYRHPHELQLQIPPDFTSERPTDIPGQFAKLTGVFDGRAGFDGALAYIKGKVWIFLELAHDTLDLSGTISRDSLGYHIEGLYEPHGQFQYVPIAGDQIRLGDYPPSTTHAIQENLPVGSSPSQDRGQVASTQDPVLDPGFGVQPMPVPTLPATILADPGITANVS